MRGRYEIVANGNPTGVRRQSMTEALLYIMFTLQGIFTTWTFTVETHAED